MRILHTSDWHLGSFRSPVKDGVNLRTEDTRRCLDELVKVAKQEQQDYVLISGDIFDVGNAVRKLLQLSTTSESWQQYRSK